MKRWNLLPAAGLGLGLVAVVGYFALVLVKAPGLTRFLEWPVLHLGLLAAGLALSFTGARRALRGPAGLRRGLASAGALALGGLNLGLAGIFCWYLFSYSYRLPEAAAAPAVGSVAPEFSLLDQAGQPLELQSFRGRNVVLVFYRGFW